MTDDESSACFNNPFLDEEARLYSVLNVPRDASAGHIHRNFKLLSRVYHPDKSAADLRDVAQQSFVVIKTAQDVLIDTVYRLAYDYGGMVAVTLVKRSQAARQSHDTLLDESKLTRDDDAIDLYTAIEQTETKQEAASIIHQFLRDYQIRKTQNLKGEFQMSCDMPQTFNTTTSADTSYLQRETVTIGTRSSLSVFQSVKASVGINSEVDHRTALTNISGVCSLDYQPVAGTHVCMDAALNHHTAPGVSVRTTRQSAAGTVMMASLGGSAANLKSWNASLVSYRTILWKPTTSLQAMWRIGYSLAGQLSYFLASVSTTAFPIWKCRLGLSSYPLKLSWQGRETNSFYIALSRGVSTTRIKIQRLSSLGHRWKLKYGLKYDGQGFYTGGSLWTISCHLYSNEYSICIPVRLGSIQPLAWVVSLLFVEFIDQSIESFAPRVSIHKKRLISPEICSSRSHHLEFASFIARVAAKKKRWEQAANGLVVLNATWLLDIPAAEHNVTEFIQFWVSNSRVLLSPKYLQWTVRTEEPQKEEPGFRLFSTLRKYCLEYSKKSVNQRPCTGTKLQGWLVVRYTFDNSVFEMRFDGVDVIELPHQNATKLGPANRIT